MSSKYNIKDKKLFEAQVANLRQRLNKQIKTIIELTQLRLYNNWQ